MSGRPVPALADLDPGIHGEPIHEPPVLLRCHPEDILLRHGPLELPVSGMNPVIDKGKTVPFKHERLKAAAFPAAEKENGMFVVRIQVKLALNNGGKFINALAHVRIIRENPDVCIM